VGSNPTPSASFPINTLKLLYKFYNHVPTLWSIHKPKMVEWQPHIAGLLATTVSGLYLQAIVEKISYSAVG
jgi:hypothetical protein